MARPAYFQISPVDNSEEESHRMGTAVTRLTSAFIEPNFGYYRGGNLGALNDRLKSFLDTPAFAAREVILATSCHGQRHTGRFSDTFGRERFRWTPALLWFGAAHRDSGYVMFEGLRALFTAARQTHFTLVFAPCYGAYFAEELHDIIQHHPLALGKTATVVGLSYGKTKRILNPNASTAPVNRIAYHRELYHWFLLGRPQQFPPGYQFPRPPAAVEWGDEEDDIEDVCIDETAPVVARVQA